MKQNPFCVCPVFCDPKALLLESIRITPGAGVATIELVVSEDVAAVMVDRVQIQRAFMNLIINALQATPPPPHVACVQIRAQNVTLLAGQVPPLPGGDFVEFEVRDNGSGIKPEHLAKVFDRFSTTKMQAIGLGLDVVRSVIRAHGGQVSLHTTVGKGTSAVVYLPVQIGAMRRC